MRMGLCAGVVAGDFAKANALSQVVAARIGRTLSVLTERGNTGRAEDFTLVRFEREVAAGEIVTVTAGAADERALIAA